MSRQYIGKSPSIQNKYSLFSKSGQRLYKRINNNIKIINKSRLSNNSNNSIGSVALRRTQLSNDKIYSREEQFMPINTSQFNADLSSLYELPNMKNNNYQSIEPDSKYRQRLFKIKSQKQIGSYSSKSRQSLLFNNNKPDKYAIQRLIMLQDKKASNQRSSQSKKQERLSHKKSTDSQSSTGKRQIIINKDQNNKYRPIRSIKSSLRSYIKSPKNDRNQFQSNNLNTNERYQFNQMDKNQIQRQNLKLLQNKYQNYYLKQERRGSSKQIKHKNIKQYKEKDYRMSKDKQRQNIQKVADNKIRRYQDVQQKNSMKYRQNQNLDRDKNRQANYRDYQYCREQEKDKVNGRKKENKNRVQNQYEKYYQNSQKNQYYRNKKIKQSQKHTQRQLYTTGRQANDQRQYFESESSLAIKSRVNRQNNFKNQGIKSKLKISRYNSNESRGQRKGQSKGQSSQYSQTSIKQNKKDHANYTSNKQIYKKDHQYYDCPSPKQSNNKVYSKKRQAQCTQTFDSLMLSINSRLNAKQYNLNSHSINVKDILQGVETHLNTLKLIQQYSNQFKKMYEQIQNWEQLIFLSFKKYYVERVKVCNFLKTFKRSKRHESQRINNQRKQISSQNQNSYSVNQLISSNNFQNNFQSLQKSTNPFKFPFCKLQEKQLKSISSTPQFSILLSKIQKQNIVIYSQLQELYNIVIVKGGNHINMLFCDNFSEQIYILMLDQIDQLIPNLQELSLFEVAKIRLGKIVKCGLLICFINGTYIQNFTQIITYDDIDKNSKRKKIKNYTCYDLYYDVFQKIVGN